MISLILFFLNNSIFASPDWSADFRLPIGETRENIYGLSDKNLKKHKKNGEIHALKWPVDITGMIVPYEPLKYFLEEEKNPIRTLLERITEKKLGYNDLDGMYKWLGLKEFPDETTGIFNIPFPDGEKPDYRMGASIIDTEHGKGLTFSCATCHSGMFLGQPIMGLTNRRPRANDFFVLAQTYLPYVPSRTFQSVTNATDGERKIFQQTKKNLKYIHAVSPQVLGLDTSLSHVGLSLLKRKDDAYASKISQRKPRRPPKLETFVSDSKPMPWWNLKYKTRWLSDGSIISGNPIFTNFLWNEIGRGTDLKELEGWMKNNEQVIQEITAAAFASKSPHWTDFFPVESINIEMAKNGEKIFTQSCQRCHGQYIKGWSLENSASLPKIVQLKTVKLMYHEKTPVIDVGTDPNRWMATKEFAKNLNKLKISKWMKTRVVPQKGYVPPPLVGIFLRYPYFHNNSIPNLCALMEHPDHRPRYFVQGPSQAVQDYDEECMGYPVGEDIPSAWWVEKGAIYDTTRSGLRNTGHMKPFFFEDGSPKMNRNEKRNLREFLKTL